MQICMNECWNIQCIKHVGSSFACSSRYLDSIMYSLVCCVIMHHRKFCFGASICHLGSNVMFYASTCYICDSFGLCCICCLETFSIGLCGLVCVVNGLLYADLLRNKSFIRPHTSSYRSISPSLAFLSERYTRRGC